MVATNTTSHEGYKGLGRADRRRMKRRWRTEGQGMSLKQWAKHTGVGDAADVWLKAKKESSS